MTLALRALALTSCALIVGCSSGSGGGQDTTVSTTETDTTVTDTSVDSSPTDTGADPCGNSVCEPALDENFTSCPGDCPALEPCAIAGETCTAGRTPDGAGLACVPEYDSLNLDDAVCLPICDLANDDSDCPSGSFCGRDSELDGPRCYPSNCTSPFQSAAQCAATSDSGGTCVDRGNDAFYCYRAGTAAKGGDCGDGALCGPGLYCHLGICSDVCAVDGSVPACDGGLECLDLLGSDIAGVCGDGCSGFGADPSECAPGTKCFPNGADTGFCVPAGPVPLGGACAEDADCGPDALCRRLDAEDPLTCHAMCDRRTGFGDATCATGEICLAENDVVGVCYPGCTPFVFVAENGCSDTERASCLPIEVPSRGVCAPSGRKIEGDACSLVDGSVLGECASGFACRPDIGSETGECVKMCATFSSVNDYESECRSGDICEIYGLAWGLCGGPAVDNAPVDAFEACSPAGRFCGDDLLCLNVDQQGNNLCIPLCRLGSDDDCPDRGGSATRCRELLASDRLGLCVP